MSGNGAGGVGPGRAWIRYGLIGGVIAFAATLAANLAITSLRPADLCRAGRASLFLLNLAAVIILFWMAAAAGFATARRVGSVPQATLSGVLVGCIAGLALLALIPFTSTVTDRLQELSAQCPGSGSFSIGGSFTFGTTPPPGIVLPTPPGFFTASPPREAFGPPPSGLAGALLSAVGLLLTISVGVGLAAGAAALAGLVGAATRPRRG